MGELGAGQFWWPEHLCLLEEPEVFFVILEVEAETEELGGKFHSVEGKRCLMGLSTGRDGVGRWFEGEELASLHTLAGQAC